MIVCLRDGKEAASVEQLRAMYPEEANNCAHNVALDIRTNLKLGELALQHQASARPY